SLVVTEDLWGFIYCRINDNINAIILICQLWLENNEAMPVKEAGMILTWTKDIKNNINIITVSSKESPVLSSGLLNPVIQELITHQFGNDIYAIELMVQNAIDCISSDPVSLDVLQKIVFHAQVIKGFLRKISNTVQSISMEERYFDLDDPSGNGLARTDMEGRVININQAYARMFNYSKEEVTKLSRQQLAPEKWHKIEKELINGLVNKKDNFMEYEKDCIKKDGTVFPAVLKAWLVKDKQGNPLGLWSIVYDITERKKAQREFEEDLLALHAVIDNIGIGISLCDKSGRFVIFNTCMQEITGYTEKEINEQERGALFYSKLEDSQKEVRRLSRAVAEKGVSSIETIIKNKDGSERILSVVKSLINYKGSEMFLSIWRDVTENKRLEDALQDSEVRFHSLIEIARDGILILDAGSGRIKEVNKFLIDMLGYSSEEFLGKEFWEMDIFIDADKSRDIFNELQDKGYIHDKDLRLKTKDGRFIDVEFVSNVYKVDHTGAIQCSIRDITERKRMEEAIRLADQEWKNTFDSIDDLIFVQDKDLNIVRANKACAEVLKMEPKDIIGRKCYDLVHNLNHPWPLGCPFEKTRKDGMSHTQEVNDPHVGIPLLVTVAPIFKSGGDFLGAVHIAKDITTHKKLEEEAQKRLQELEVFYKASLDREERIIELKKEVEMLKRKLDEK
ncbi:MAG: PAS domain S-box protein, partial [Candidatus Omnitrophica bacterium]|nr:PAS domain S-box protein [Candidatus Omnitrophota bacterium]